MRIPDDPVAARLRDARIAVGYRTAKAFWAQHDIPQPTYSMHETGRRKIDIETLLDYATKLGVSVQWLATGQGAMKGDGDLVPVLGTEPTYGTARGALPKEPRNRVRPRNRLGEMLVAKGVDGRDLAKRTGIAQRRLAAIADGAEVSQAELDAIADALGLGVFDIFDFAPLTRDEAALVIDLRHISADDRKNVRAYIEAMKLKAANDQKVVAPKPARKKSA